MLKLYSDLKKHYVLLEYHAVHNKMIIRCLKNEFENRSYNIDVFFEQVSGMILPDKLDGIEIYVLDFDEVPKLILDCCFEDFPDSKVFLIKDGVGNDYFVKAISVGVYQNYLSSLESWVDVALIEREGIEFLYKRK